MECNLWHSVGMVRSAGTRRRAGGGGGRKVAKGREKGVGRNSKRLETKEDTLVIEIKRLTHADTSSRITMNGIW